ncbi:Aldehyde dehydrogenase family 3 member B1 [Sarcoptes scabiei]|nr:Aldehyde dehydrogenase family 3 member B1 [Sarcoptes scabiei]
MIGLELLSPAYKISFQNFETFVTLSESERRVSRMPYYTSNMARYMREQDVQSPSDQTRSKFSRQFREQNFEHFVSSIVDPTLVQSMHKIPQIMATKYGTRATATSPYRSPKSMMMIQRVTRMQPSFVEPNQAQQHQLMPEFKREDFDATKLRYMRNLLQRQVQRIANLQESNFIRPISERLDKYTINLEENLEWEKQINEKEIVHPVQHVDYPNLSMVGRILERRWIRNPVFFKILKHLGKKHPFILQTWEILELPDFRVMIIQEQPYNSDIEEYVMRHGPQDERQSFDWARQLYKALDYLGDMAICHNNLQPRFVKIDQFANLHLTGFFDSMVYWSIDNCSVMCFPCQPLTERNFTTPDFKAPEVYGDPLREQYDPIMADIWSYGAIIYFVFTGHYPHDYRILNPEIEYELNQNVRAMSISASGQDFLANLLTTQVGIRLNFDKIIKHAWFEQFPKKFGKQSPRRLKSITRTPDSKFQRSQIPITQIGGASNYFNVNKKDN